MTVPLWTILIPTIGRRAAKFRRLAIELLAQAEPRLGDVRVLAYYNNGERPLAHVRQALLQGADSTYVSFVDDDDWVPNDYVGQVRAAILGHATQARVDWRIQQYSDGLPDYVAWRMQHYSDGVPSKPTYHSLTYGGWHDDQLGYYRDISHLNPIRRDLALQVDFRDCDPPEDVSWAIALRKLGVVKTEARIPDEHVMYHYYASGDSTWMPGKVQPEPGLRRPKIEHPLFDWHPDSSE